MNKYKSQSKEAQARRKRERMCGQKIVFPTEEAAYQKGQRSYHCPHCTQWHRSGSLTTLINKLAKKQADVIQKETTAFAILKCE